MRNYTPIAAIGAIAAAIIGTAVSSTVANAAPPGCRHPHLHRYVACTDALKARTPVQAKMQFMGAPRGGAVPFRRR